jgi:hypothetical protein
MFLHFLSEMLERKKTAIRAMASTIGKQLGS